MKKWLIVLLCAFSAVSLACETAENNTSGDNGTSGDNHQTGDNNNHDNQNSQGNVIVITKPSQTCGSNEALCDDGVCRDIKTSVSNCGRCGKTCNTGETCVNGECYSCTETQFRSLMRTAMDAAAAQHGSPQRLLSWAAKPLCSISISGIPRTIFTIPPFSSTTLSGSWMKQRSTPDSPKTPKLTKGLWQMGGRGPSPLRRFLRGGSVDSAAIIDNFRWITSGGSVSVGTDFSDGRI